MNMIIRILVIMDVFLLVLMEFVLRFGLMECFLIIVSLVGNVFVCRSIVKLLVLLMVKFLEI